MGAAACTQEGVQCDVRQCGSGGRPALDGQGEYEPQGKNAGLKEYAEPAMPSAAAIGKALDRLRLSDGKFLGASPRAEPSITMTDGLTATARTAQVGAQGLRLSVANAVSEITAEGPHDVEAAARDGPQVGAMQAEGTIVGRGFDPFQAANWNTQAITSKMKAEMVEVADWVHRGHCTLRLFCLGVALLLLATSVIGVLNVFKVVTPFQYLLAVYNVIFAFVIIVIDVKAIIPMRLCDIRQRIFEACWFLSHAKGKAMFYMYVGSINLIMFWEGGGDWKIIYLITGGSLFFAGLWILTDGFGYCCARYKSPGEQVAENIQNGAMHVVDGAHQAAVAANMQYCVIKSYVQNHPMTLKLICFLISLALLASSILGMLNIFSALFQPFQYMMACYNVLFALVIALLDGRREWFERCWDIRKKLLRAAPCLGWLVGRAFFFFYVGSINLAMLPSSSLWKIIYIGIGGALCVAGVLMILHRYVCRSRELDDLMGFAEET